MKKNLLTFAISFFFIFTFGVLVWFNISKSRVLILQSYNDDYSWVKDVNVGIKRVMKDKSHYSIRWYYMDTKRHPWQQYKINAGVVARRMIDSWKPDVIIAVDDDAQQFVTKHYVNNPKIRIVFSGVNNELADYGFDKATNVTGILERLPLTAVKEGLYTHARLSGNNRPVRVIFLGDKSETVLGDAKWTRAFDWAPAQLVDTILVDNFDDWKEAVKKAQERADYIITSNYRKVAREKGGKELVPALELISWTDSASVIPVIGTNAFFPEDGGMMAIATSPFEQGEVAAKMAADIIDNNKSPKDIPVVTTKQFVVSMLDSRIREKKFVMPMIYEACARASNKYYK